MKRLIFAQLLIAATTLASTAHAQVYLHANLGWGHPLRLRYVPLPPIPVPVVSYAANSQLIVDPVPYGFDKYGYYGGHRRYYDEGRPWGYRPNYCDGGYRRYDHDRRWDRGDRRHDRGRRW